MTDLAPSATKIQEESVAYTFACGEKSFAQIGALANYIREIISPLGTVVWSALEEDAFQSQNDSTLTRWVLADGRDVTGSAYETLTGASSIPDLRGVFIRDKNYARSGSTGNPNGDLAVGTYEADEFLSHNHNFNDPHHTHSFTPNVMVDRVNGYQVWGGPPFGHWSAYDITTNFPFLPFQSITTVSTGVVFLAAGGNESRARNVTLNPFIRIN